MRFEQETRPAVGVVGMFALDFFEGDLAVQFRIEGDRDFPEATLGMRPKLLSDAEVRGLVENLDIEWDD